MRECAITQESHGSYDVLRLQGSLDSFSFPRLEKALNELRDNKRNRVILECAGLNYISSVAIGALIGFARRARENQGDLKLANLSPKIQNIIELLGFQRILEVHARLEDAAQKFSAA